MGTKAFIDDCPYVCGYATSAIKYSRVGRGTVAENIAFAFVPYFWLFSGGVPINGNFKKAIALLALMFFGVVGFIH